MSGQITRKEIIEDEALKWGPEYSKNVQIAIDKHKEFVTGILSMVEANNKLRGSSNPKEYADNQKKVNAELQKTVTVWKEQIQLENALISTKKKNELATESTNRALVKERLELAQVNKQLKQETLERLGLVSAYTKLNNARTEAKNKLRDLIASENASTAEIKKATVEFEKLDTKIKKADKAVGDFTKNVGNYKSALLGIKDIFAAFGFAGGLGATVSILKEAFEVTRNFEKEVVNLAAISGKSRSEIKPLEDKIREVSKASINGATDVAKLATELIKLGSTTEEAEKLLKPVNDLSIALQATAEDSATLVKSILNSYNLGAEEAGRVTDVLAAAANKSALDFDGLRDSFSYLAPAAKALDIPIEKTAAIIGTLADNGIKAESAGRLTSTAFARLANQGLTLEDALGKINKAQEDGSSNLEVLALASNLFGAEAGKIGLILANNTEKIAENTLAYENSKGSLEELTNKQLKSLDAELKIVSSAWEDYILGANESSGASSKLGMVIHFVGENLKTILNVLGYAIAAWLAYKASILLASAQTKLLALYTTQATVAQESNVIVTEAGTVAQVANATATTAATTAWQRFNTALKANALLLIISALIAAVYYFNKFNKSLSETTEETKKGTSEFLNHRDSVSKASTSINTLSNRYDALKSKSKLTKEEQVELNEIIKTLAKTVPEAVSEVDKYGDALAINTVKTRAFTASQKELNGLETKKKLIENKELLKQLEVEQSTLNRTQQEGTRNTIEGLGVIIKKNGILYSDGITGINKLTLEEQILFKQKVVDNERNIAITKQNIKSLSGLSEAEKEVAKQKEESIKKTIANGPRTIEIIDAEIKAQQDLISTLSDKTGKEGNVIKKKISALQAERDLIYNNDRDSKKSEKDKLDEQKRIADAIYELKKQRLEQEIKLNNDIVNNEEETDSTRLEALEQSQDRQTALLLLNRDHLLNNDKLLVNDRIRINEDYQNKVIELNKKTQEEIDKINQFDEAAYQANLNEGVKKIEIAQNAELEAEEKKFQELEKLGFDSDKAREDAVRKHEEALFNIKKEFAIATARLQLSNLESELDAYELQSDGSKKSQDFILEKRKQISDASLKLTQLEGDTFKNNEENKVLTAKEKTETILQISSDLTGALTDLSNAFTASEIQKIDDQIEKNNEFYDRQIELAGNDEKQKDLLNKEREKKNAELEKKKRAAQHKQAVYDKAAAVAQAGISTALAVLNALNTVPYLPLGPIMAASAATFGAIQIATIIATPIPKYKMGRKGGPAEIAEVGDGFVHEVITSPDGSNPRLTPNKPTLTLLGKDDIVHKSVDDYNRYMRASLLNKFTQDNHRVIEFQSEQNNDMYGKESLQVMKETLMVLKKQKNGTIINLPKVDINHHLWKQRNTNWK